MTALQSCLESDDRLNVNCFDPHGRTMLHLAVERNNVAVIRFLTARKDIDIDATTLPDGWSALHLAAAAGHAEAAQVGTPCSVGSTHLWHRCVRSLCLCLPLPRRVVQMLLARGASVHMLDRYGRTALHRAAYKGGKVPRAPCPPWCCCWGTLKPDSPLPPIYASALCNLLLNLCSLPSAFCPLPSAFCPLPSALCPLPSAPCPLPLAPCPSSFAL